jgi:hypothetical protein
MEPACGDLTKSCFQIILRRAGRLEVVAGTPGLPVGLSALRLGQEGVQAQTHNSQARLSPAHPGVVSHAPVRFPPIIPGCRP